MTRPREPGAAGPADPPWGGPARLSPAETLMWRTDADPRTRSTGVLVEILETAPDWDRLVAAHEHASRAIPRLRDRVLDASPPLVGPTWTPDHDFDLARHLHRIQLPRPGSRRQLLDLAASLAERPLDRDRPPWEVVLVEGLAGGQAGYLLKLHHAMADGLGLVQLLNLAHSPTAVPGGSPLRALPDAGVTTGETESTAPAPGAPADRALELLGRALEDPSGSFGQVLDYVLSLNRMLRLPAGRSPLLSGAGATYRAVVHEVPLDALKSAAAAAGGTVNDAYLAGVLGAFRRYHEHFGQPLDQLPMAIPISLRNSRDPKGGNRFTGARFVAPVGEPDPRTRIRLIGEAVRTLRAEPAIAFVEVLGPLLSALPSPLLTELTAQLLSACDVQASNIAGMPEPVYLAGARVLRVYPIGPRPGVAAMVTMLSYHGTCCIGVNLDPAAITEPEIFESCLRAGFDEVTALSR